MSATAYRIVGRVHRVCVAWPVPYLQCAYLPSRRAQSLDTSILTAENDFNSWLALMIKRTQQMQMTSTQTQYNGSWLASPQSSRFTRSILTQTTLDGTGLILQLIKSNIHDTFTWANGCVFALLGPFYGAIAVPSVTRCRCCCCRRRRCCGHRCAGGVRLWRRATVATPGEWQCGVWRLAVANGPNIFQMLLVNNIPA